MNPHDGATGWPADNKNTRLRRVGKALVSPFQTACIAVFFVGSPITPGTTRTGNRSNFGDKSRRRWSVRNWRTGEQIMPRPISAAPGLRPLHPLFVGMGGTLLIAAAFTDAMYVSNALMQWANFSAWLITCGLVLALVSVLVLGLDALLGNAGRIRGFDFGLLAAAAILSLFNVFVHTRDAWTSVVPAGIVLSVLVAIMLVIVGVRGWTVTEIRVDRRGDTV
jgi:uncharacterized membrane protein